MDAQNLAIVIPVFGKLEYTRKCLLSLADARPLPLVIVVDDASPDGSAEAIREEFPSVVLLRNDANSGFAVSCNRGIERALTAGVAHVLLLNNDTIVPPTMITELLAATGPDVAAVGAVICDYEDAACAQISAGKMHPWLGLVSGMRHRDEAVMDCDTVIGCAMFMSAAALRTVGSLAEGYFCYGEETDWCLRARRAGYRIVLSGGARVLHRGKATGGSEFAEYYDTRNRALMIRRCSPTVLHRVSGLVFHMLYTLGVEIACAWLMGRRPVRHRWAALWSGLQGETGRRPN